MRRALVGLRKWGEVVWWMRQAGGPTPKIRIRHSDEFPIPWDVAIDPIPGGFELVYNNGLASPRHALFSKTIAKITPALYARALASDDVGRIVVNLSDGDYFSDAGFMYSTNWDRMTMLPDWYFFRSHGFQELRAQIDRLSVPWEQRTEDLVWRGSTTGNGFSTVFPHLMKHPKTVQRLQMAAHAEGTGLDVGFVNPPGHHFYDALKARGYIKDKIANTAWFGKKYAVDIDGQSCTWDNFFHRLLMGCCVLKVESAFGYRQWYYDDIRPFEHYVPVRADFSDLKDKIAWIRAHDTEAGEIAENGQQFAISMTFEREMQRGKQAIEENWARYV